MYRLELTGQTFGSLTVLAQTTSTARGSRWICLCACGRQTVVRGEDLTSGNTTSCGCIGRAALGNRTRTHGQSHRIPEYKTWARMKQRCINPRDKSYPNWGGRGITVCAAWRADFAAFYRDMGPRPSPAHTLDRIDNMAGYAPENCRWATRLEQAHNQRQNRPLTLNGRTQLMVDWARELGITPAALHRRLRGGWSLDDALSRRRLPPGQHR